jgi:hypothetical protein
MGGRATRLSRAWAVLLVAVGSSLLVPTNVAAQQAGFADPAAEGDRAAARFELGQRIYREGIGASGEPLRALGAARTPLAGKDVACAACHRRSGYGTSEGRYTIRPITGPALLQEQTLPVQSPRIKALLGTRQRPAYDEALLARAIGSGVDASGKPLDSLMPRYAMTAQEMEALGAYLFTLSSRPSPGVDDRDIHFATVIQPGVSPERRRAMLDIMQAFVKDKDANGRSEEQRRDAGNMRMYRSFRKWVLHVWELKGSSDTWSAQLEANYRQQPVFALIGGLGSSSWRPIHEFSERFEIPTVLPQVDLPVLSGPNQYTFYFSRGIVLEAEVLARFLRDQRKPGKVVQVYRRDEAALAASTSLRAALEANAGDALEDHVLEGSADEDFWRRVLARRPDALVLWLGPKDLESAQALGGSMPTPTYVSFDLLGGRRPATSPVAGADVRMVYPSDLRPKRDARLLRSKVWLHGKGIPTTDEAVQVNTQFAMTVVSDVVGHIMDSFSRDLFVERIEHVVGQTPMPSTFPQVSLGPGQRFAAKGAAVVRLPDADKSDMAPISGWIVP